MRTKEEEDCPRCHGNYTGNLKSDFRDQPDVYKRRMPQNTLVLINVMGSERREYWRCNQCGYTERRAY